MSEQIIPLSSEDLLCDIPTIAENEAAKARKRQEEQQIKERPSKDRHHKERHTRHNRSTAVAEPEPIAVEQPTETQAPTMLPPVKQVDVSDIKIDLPPVEQPTTTAPVINLPIIEPIAPPVSPIEQAITITLPDLQPITASTTEPLTAKPPVAEQTVAAKSPLEETATKKPSAVPNSNDRARRKRSNTANNSGTTTAASKESRASQQPMPAPAVGKQPSNQRSERYQADGKQPVSQRSERSPVTGKQPAGQRSERSPVTGKQPASRRSEHTQTIAESPTRQRHSSNKKKTRKRSAVSVIFCILRRTLLVIFTLVLLVFVSLCLILNLAFNGPSPAARDKLTMSLLEPSGTKWIPGLFLDDETLQQIKDGDAALFANDEDPANLPPVEINTDTSLTANNDEWKDYPDGIRIENVSGDTYNAYVMIVRDPSAVYLATSTDEFSMDIPGTRITNQIETEGAIAAINAGAFFDNGTSDPSVGSVPQGLVLSGGEVVWNSGAAPEEGFVGFNQNNELVVADSMTATKAMELGIRDGCCFGPVLIQNGVIKDEVYNSNSGYNPRTAIGQRKDGAVIMVCIDGRQTGSLGATYSDIINIMYEYDAVNACNLDGGSSTIMLYRDQYGRYGEAGKVQMINNYSLLQSQPRKMPTFFMVRPSGEE